MQPSIPFGDIEIINVVDINPGISKVYIKVCYVQEAPNRNKSIITKEFAKNTLANSLKGAPIVGYYNEDLKDFEEHNKYLHWDDETGEVEFKSETQVFGFVDLNAKIWFQNFLDGDGVQREYLCTEGYIFTMMFPEAERVLEKGNNQSMELDNVNGTWTKDLGGRDKFFIINEAIIKNLCLLGEDVEPCFEGAQVRKEFSLKSQDLNNQLLNLIKQFNFNKGEEIMDYKIDEIPEYKELQEKFSALEADFKVLKDEKAQLEADHEEMKKKCHSLEEAVGKYNLDDVVEYQELKAQFDALEAECQELRDFKCGVETEKKKQMVEKFTVIPQEEKDRILNALDEYSVDQIESEFAVYCFRNGLNFKEKEVQEPQQIQEPVQFHLEDPIKDEIGEALKNNK